jgi:hypothetical protein
LSWREVSEAYWFVIGADERSFTTGAKAMSEGEKGLTGVTKIDCWGLQFLTESPTNEGQR